MQITLKTRLNIEQLIDTRFIITIGFALSDQLDRN